MINSSHAVLGSMVRGVQLAAAAAISCIALPALPATGPVVTDTYITLALPGVVGNFTMVPNAPANAIQVLALSVGGSCAISTCQVQDLSIQKFVDSASPKLFLALVANTTYATATVNFWQAPASGTNYTKTYTIHLTQAKLSSDQLSGPGGGGSPSENLTLSFASIAFQDNVTGSVSCYNTTTKATTLALTC